MRELGMTVDGDPVEEDPTTGPDEAPEEAPEEVPEEAEPAELSALQRFIGKFRKS